jgi:glycosyltransferase involved in cell wall biosynthesis
MAVMRIVMLVPELVVPAGMESAVLGLTQALIGMGQPAIIVTKRAALERPGIPIIEVADLERIPDEIIAGSIIVDHGTFRFQDRKDVMQVAFLHSEPLLVPEHGKLSLEAYTAQLRRYDRVLAASRYVATQVKKHCGVDAQHVPLFAHPAFSSVGASSPRRNQILFPHRLIADKGIGEMLTALNHPMLAEARCTFVDLGDESSETAYWRSQVLNQPRADLVPARTTPESVAELLASHSVVVQPSKREALGLASIEAQHAGCRVIASKVGGLPETDCGLLQFVDSTVPASLATALARALAQGSPTNRQIHEARKQFRLDDSGSSLLAALNATSSDPA